MSTRLVPLVDVFNIDHGNKLDLNKMVRSPVGEHAIAFVGRSGAYNGFSAFVERVEGVDPYDSGLITVALGGSVLSSFVQPICFYTAQNVHVLEARSDMSLDLKLYYCACIEANRFRYSTYGREANRTLRTIPVPAVDQVPRWVMGVSIDAIDDFCNELKTRASLTE